MTFITEGLSPAARQNARMAENLQLMFMNQSSLHNLAFQATVNGFVDTFSNNDAIDLTLSKASYDEPGKYFSELPGQTGITEIIRIDNTTKLEMSESAQLTVSETGLAVNRVLISNGAINTSVIYATPAMSSNVFPLPAVISASSEYVSPNCPAWRAFDQNENHSTNPEECWIAVATATEAAPQWIKIDLGTNSGKIINKYAIQSRNSPDPSFVSSPKNFRLLGSNDDIFWITLDSVQELPELASNTWGNYRTFDNNVPYRFYKLEITASYGTGLTSLSQLKLVEASYSVPTEPEIAILSGHSTDNWSSITNISANSSTPGSSRISYALSFNKGADSEKWDIWNGSAWKTIVQIYSGTWKYSDNSGTSIESPTNTRLNALKLAFELETNQMDNGALSSINEKFSEVFTSGELAIAIGMEGDENLQIPSLDHLSIGHNENGFGLDLISRPYSPYSLISKIQVAFLAKNMSPETGLLIGMGVDTPIWVEPSGYSKKATLTNGIEYYSAWLSNLETNLGPIQLRITAPAGTGVEIHGWALNWDD